MTLHPLITAQINWSLSVFRMSSCGYWRVFIGFCVVFWGGVYAIWGWVL